MLIGKDHQYKYIFPKGISNEAFHGQFVLLELHPLKTAVMCSHNNRTGNIGVSLHQWPTLQSMTGPNGLCSRSSFRSWQSSLCNTINTVNMLSITVGNKFTNIQDIVTHQKCSFNNIAFLTNVSQAIHVTTVNVFFCTSGSKWVNWKYWLSTRLSSLSRVTVKEWWRVRSWNDNTPSCVAVSTSKMLWWRASCISTTYLLHHIITVLTHPPTVTSLHAFVIASSCWLSWHCAPEPLWWYMYKWNRHTGGHKPS